MTEWLNWTELNDFKVYPCRSMCFYLIFYWWITFHYLSINFEGDLACFYFGEIMHNTAMNICVDVFVSICENTTCTKDQYKCVVTRGACFSFYSVLLSFSKKSWLWCAKVINSQMGQIWPTVYKTVLQNPDSGARWSHEAALVKALQMESCASWQLPAANFCFL